jgi:hypothetical protein
MLEANAILAISSTDRYITVINGRGDRPITSTLESEYQNSLPFSNDFSISPPRALINGYISKMIVSQIQLQYNVPTIQANNNDSLFVKIELAPGAGVYGLAILEFPYGFFTPYELAILLEIQLNARVGDGFFTVTYNQGDPLTEGSPDYIPYPPGYFSYVGFKIESNNNRLIYIPNTIELAAIASGSQTLINIHLKAARLFGFNVLNSHGNYTQRSWTIPQFLPTPYIDIYSDALTNYQKLKDGDSSTSSRKGLISRLYLANANSIQSTTASGALGTAPFVACYDFNTPKVIGWSPDTAVNSLDFQLRDCYGELLFVYNPTYDINGDPDTAEVFNTEFQMTLLCVEG